jgi:transmembrane sensor
MAVIEGELNEAVFKDLVDRGALLKRISSQVTGLPSSEQGYAGSPARRALRRLARSKRLALLAAGVATIAFGLVFGLKHFPSAQRFATAEGEQRAVELADGSVVILNSASRVAVHFGGSARELELAGGEALFKVAKDPHRPFRVRTHDTTVQALGTEFNVNARAGDTVVSVLEGRVLVSTREGGQLSQGPAEVTALAAGEAVRIHGKGEIDRERRPDVVDATQWRARQLVFEHAAIGDIVREFNRHNVAPKLRLEGMEPASRHYSAIFDAEDPSSFADFLKHEPDVVVEQRGKDVVIRGR